ncbi:putative Fe-S cluster assembly protein SufT [Francisella frigiditurris]|uniref:MIP18 family-like domain-containing protein n=1 Tax=Francisella frigiditurris TaxID=1542390 RepID=A0A1J0KR34_9GAMM|nr:putative Fe-S cluster assembly protein SufT [Francisella frigiditurris]APC96207.1 hypothetical protein KX01_1798 [Francisella frigiditurris]
MKPTDVTIIRREVVAVAVPFGNEITLMPGQEALVTQDKGGSFTLNVNGNLLHLDGKDADAIGKAIVKYPVEKYDIKPGDPINMDAIWDQMRTVYDPEIPVNIVDLGLVYNVSTRELENGNFHVIVDMTLTAPGCGMGPILMKDVETRVAMLPNVDKVDVIMVFDPPWNSELMTEEAKLELGLF